MRERLTSLGYRAYLDTHDILPGEAWQERLGRLISRADGVIFLISPDSVASVMCDWEINEAERLSKRILPVVIRDADPNRVPGRLKRLNYIFLRGPAEEPEGFTRISKALLTDIEWVRQHTRFGELAADWQHGQSALEHLLRGDALSAAEAWLSQPHSGEERPTHLHREFISQSRAAETTRLKAERIQIARTRRFQKWAAWGLTSAAVLLLGGLSVVVWQNYRTSKREQAVLLSKILEAHIDQRHDRVKRLAVYAYPAPGALPWAPFSPEIEGWLGSATMLSRLLVKLNGNGERLHFVSFSQAGDFIVTGSRDGTTSIWDVASGRAAARFSDHEPGTSGQTTFGAVIAPNTGGARIFASWSSWQLRIHSWDQDEFASTGSEPKTDYSRSWELEFTKIFVARFNKGGRLVVLAAVDETAQFQTIGFGSYPTVRFIYPSPVTSATLAPDGARAVTLHDDGSAHVWDTATGLRLRSFDGGVGRATTAIYSANGRRLVTFGDSYSAKVWDIETGKQTTSKLLSCGNWITSASLDPIGERLVASCEKGDPVVWDAVSGQQLQALKGHSGAVSFATFSPDGTRILTTSDDKTARLWSASRGTEIAALKSHSSAVVTAAFSTDGRRVVTASDDGSAAIWDANDRSKSSFDAMPEPLPASAAGGSQISSISYISFDSAGEQVITAGNDGAARVWATRSGALLATLRGHKDNVHWAAISHDSKYAATASADRTARVWEINSGQEVARLALTDSWESTVMFSGQSDTLLIGQHGSALVWAWRGDQHYELTAEEPGASLAAFSRDGRLSITSSKDGSAILWDVASRSIRLRLKGSGELIKRFVFSADGLRISTIRNNDEVQVWDVMTGLSLGRPLGRSSGVPVAFSPDGTRLVALRNDMATSKVQLWNTLTGREEANLSGHRNFASFARFSPDGRRVLTTSLDKSVRVWDVTSGQFIGEWVADPESPVLGAQFSADGATLLTWSSGSVVRIWDLTWMQVYGATLRSRVCQSKLIGGEEFTSEELADPILRDIDPADHWARTPCLGRGPLAGDYWLRLPYQMWRSISSALRPI